MARPSLEDATTPSAAKQGLLLWFRRGCVMITEEEKKQFNNEWLRWLNLCFDIGCIGDNDIQQACAYMLTEFRDVPPWIRFGTETVFREEVDAAGPREPSPRSPTPIKMESPPPVEIAFISSESTDDENETENVSLMPTKKRARPRGGKHGGLPNPASRIIPAKRPRVSICNTPTPEPVSRASARIKTKELDSVVQEAMDELLQNIRRSYFVNPPLEKLRDLPSSIRTMPFEPGENARWTWMSSSKRLILVLDKAGANQRSLYVPWRERMYEEVTEPCRGCKTLHVPCVQAYHPSILPLVSDPRCIACEDRGVQCRRGEELTIIGRHLEGAHNYQAQTSSGLSQTHGNSNGVDRPEESISPMRFRPRPDTTISTARHPVRSVEASGSQTSNDTQLNKHSRSTRSEKISTPPMKLIPVPLGVEPPPFVAKGKSYWKWNTSSNELVLVLFRAGRKKNQNVYIPWNGEYRQVKPPCSECDKRQMVCIRQSDRDSGDCIRCQNRHDTCKYPRITTRPVIIIIDSEEEGA